MVLSLRGTPSLCLKIFPTSYIVLLNKTFIRALFWRGGGDIAKVFDTINHTVLLFKQQNYGFRGPFVSLLQNFFLGRSQRASMGNFKSDRVLLKDGVPQGSFCHLCCSICLLMTSQPGLLIAKCTIMRMMPYSFSRQANYQKAVRVLQQDTTRVMDWFFENFITVNASKTRPVCFWDPLKQVNFDESFVLHRSSAMIVSVLP